MFPQGNVDGVQKAARGLPLHGLVELDAFVHLGEKLVQAPDNQSQGRSHGFQRPIREGKYLKSSVVIGLFVLDFQGFYLSHVLLQALATNAFLVIRGHFQQ